MTAENIPVQAGNMATDAADTRGWLVGSFISQQLGLRHSDNVEIKWGTHAAGEARVEWVTGETRTTIGILVAGSFEMEFRDQTLRFDTPGDYVMWGPGTDHKWRAPTDCTWLTIRWPSARA